MFLTFLLTIFAFCNGNLSLKTAKIKPKKYERYDENWIVTIQIEKITRHKKQALLLMQ